MCKPLAGDADTLELAQGVYAPVARWPLIVGSQKPYGVFGLIDRKYLDPNCDRTENCNDTSKDNEFQWNGDDLLKRVGRGTRNVAR